MSIFLSVDYWNILGKVLMCDVWVLFTLMSVAQSWAAELGRMKMLGGLLYCSQLSCHVWRESGQIQAADKEKTQTYLLSMTPNIHGNLLGQISLLAKTETALGQWLGLQSSNELVFLLGGKKNMLMEWLILTRFKYNNTEQWARSGVQNCDAYHKLSPANIVSHCQ